MHQFGDLTVRLIRSHHELDSLAIQGLHCDGDDSIIYDDAPTEMFSGLFLHTFLQILKSFQSILFFLLFSFLDGLIFSTHVPAIEDDNWFDAVIGEDLEHFEDIVKEIVSLDILIMFESTSVAALVEPGHDIYCSCLSPKGAYMFIFCDWA